MDLRERNRVGTSRGEARTSGGRTSWVTDEWKERCAKAYDACIEVWKTFTTVQRLTREWIERRRLLALRSYLDQESYYVLEQGDDPDLDKVHRRAHKLERRLNKIRGLVPVQFKFGARPTGAGGSYMRGMRKMAQIQAREAGTMDRLNIARRIERQRKKRGLSAFAA